MKTFLVQKKRSFVIVAPPNVIKAMDEMRELRPDSYKTCYYTEDEFGDDLEFYFDAQSIDGESPEFILDIDGNVELKYG